MRENSLATGMGLIAICLWALLAWLTSQTGDVPPFALVAMTFGIAFLAWLFRLGWLIRKKGVIVLNLFRQSWKIWLLGIGGLFLYHAFYFAALDNAPAIDASLIAYLWPLLIVLFSGFLPNERTRLWPIFGAFLGFLGAVLIILGKGETQWAEEYALGYFFAFLCAFTWSGYSILSRLSGKVTSDVIGPCCGATALLGWVCHALWEPAIGSVSSAQYAAIISLGIGPVGLAFFVWDYGIKRGDIIMLGALSYFSPLLSSAVLILTGVADFTSRIALSALLITFGAICASQGDAFFKAIFSMKRLNK